MRRLLAGLLFLAMGCSGEDPPPVTDRSYWWAPLASWRDADLIHPVLTLLAERGIDAFFVGSRGERISAPWERHAEAVALLRASPHAAKLKIHTLLAGPRPNAFLPKLDAGAEGAMWTHLVVFKLADVSVPKLQAALNAENVEAGVVSFAWAPENGHLYVPATSVAAARRLLKSPPWAGLLVLPP